MKARLLPALLAVLTTLVLGAGTAPAVPLDWSVTPGGAFTGVGGPVDVPLTCAGTTIAGVFNTGVSPLGIIDEMTYHGCAMGGVLPVQITLHFPWPLNGIDHANGVTSIHIDDIGASISGPACAFEVTGSAATSFDNATSVLTVHEQNTMITVVDPANDCLGLISAGERIPLLSDSYAISPAQVIEVG